jgi:hypothetical protein
MINRIRAALLFGVVSALLSVAPGVVDGHAAAGATVSQQLVAFRATVSPLRAPVERCITDLEILGSDLKNLQAGAGDVAAAKAALGPMVADCQVALHAMDRFGNTARSIRAALPAVLRANATVVDLVFQMRRLLDNSVAMGVLLQQYVAGTSKSIAGVYTDIANAKDAEAHVTADQTTLDLAWGLSNTSPVGAWTDTSMVVTAGPQKGQRFSRPVVINFYDPTSGAFSGTEGPYKVAGELHGGSVTATISGSGYVAHHRGTITFYPDGGATWTGTWSDSYGDSGTWIGIRKARA